MFSKIQNQNLKTPGLSTDTKLPQIVVDILWRKGQSLKTSTIKTTTPLTTQKIQNLFQNYSEEPKTLLRISHYLKNLGHFILGVPFRIDQKNQDKIKEKSYYVVNSQENTDIDLWILLGERNKTKVKENNYHLITEDEVYTKKLNTQGLRFLYQTKGVKIGFNYTLTQLTKTLKQKFTLTNPVMRFQNESRELVEVIRIIDDKTDNNYKLKTKSRQEGKQQSDSKKISTELINSLYHRRHTKTGNTVDQNIKVTTKTKIPNKKKFFLSQNTNIKHRGTNNYTNINCQSESNSATTVNKKKVQYFLAEKIQNDQIPHVVFTNEIFDESRKIKHNAKQIKDIKQKIGKIKDLKTSLDSLTVSEGDIVKEPKEEEEEEQNEKEKEKEEKEKEKEEEEKKNNKVMENTKQDKSEMENDKKQFKELLESVDHNKNKNKNINRNRNLQGLNKNTKKKNGYKNVNNYPDNNKIIDQNINKVKEIFLDFNNFNDLWDEIFIYIAEQTKKNSNLNGIINSDLTIKPMKKNNKTINKKKIMKSALKYLKYYYRDVFHDLNPIRLMETYAFRERVDCFYYCYDGEKEGSQLKLKRKEMKVYLLPYCYQRTESNDIFLLQLENGKKMIAKINLKIDKKYTGVEKFNQYKMKVKNHSKKIQYSKEWNKLNPQYSITFLNKMVIRFKTQRSPHYDYILTAVPFWEDINWENYKWFSSKMKENEIYHEKIEELNAFEHYFFMRTNKKMFIKCKKGADLTHKTKGGIYSSKIFTKDHYRRKKSKLKLKTFEEFFKRKHKCNRLCKKLKLSNSQTDLQTIQVKKLTQGEKKHLNRYSICKNIFCCEKVSFTFKQYLNNPNKECFDCRSVSNIKLK
ncbi:heavy chain kinase a [Anaeramoeba flamelloides]|uniref:Heavy chain kinase a n=1 Tax=Anaeramoeba flamelloides TaxID=1746091 RepID=A0ABQ8YYW3_9EUKA|nr:heavy chain kinase a [Anaeramoeba flamelloides]